MNFILKNLTVLNLNATLILIAKDIEREFGLNVVTSAYRPSDIGVHGDHRGLDLRCRSQSQGELVTNWINSKWQYDRTRWELKVCVAHGKGSNYHLHLQVHPNTRRKNAQ